MRRASSGHNKPVQPSTRRSSILSSRKHVSTDEKYLSAQLRSQSLQNKNHVSICVLPTEVLLYIFQYLDASDLLIAARVCRDWLSIANDNVLWQMMCRRYVRSGPAGIGTPLEVPILYWKKLCVQRSTEFRNKRVLAKLKAIDPYTSLPANISRNLKEMGPIFTLTFLDGSGSHHYIRHDDCFYHRMSVTARWYSFTNLPSLDRISSIKLLSLNPVFYDQNGQACQNSPCQRSLLKLVPLKWRELISKTSPIASDSTVDSYSLGDVLISVWKDGGELAFISANFHFHQLVERCIHGTFQQPYETGVHRPLRTAVDPLSGLHGYGATVELRNQRHTMFSQQFRHMDSSKSLIGGGFCQFPLIRSDDTSSHMKLDRAIEFLWKTDLFKNRTKGLCVLDLCVKDEHGRLVWCVSDFVRLESSSVERFSYEYEGSGSLIRHSDSIGRADLYIDKVVDGNELMMSGLSLFLSLKHINALFTTRY